jgi:flavin reductase (DIM6/NTAB) family NADH-FMN oxidoreductase RutF
MRFVDAERFKAGMSQVAGAVWVVATWNEDQPWGLTATAVCSFTADPPALLVCVNRDAGAHDHILASRRLSVNLLGAAQSDVASRFAGREGHQGQDRFAGVAWRRSASGAPVLDDCLAAFECEVITVYESRTHTAFVCGVVGLDLAGAATEPLLYFQRDFTTVQPRKQVTAEAA